METRGEAGTLTVGARVEVLWEGAVYAAEVVKCRARGAFDVVYEGGGELGTWLTRKKHRLRLFGKKPSVKEKEEEEEEEEKEMEDEDENEDEDEDEDTAVKKKKKKKKKKRRNASGQMVPACFFEGCTKQVAARDSVNRALAMVHTECAGQKSAPPPL